MSAKEPPPLLGFNNNVRHKGRVFHIQTEDSGVKHPRIVTHLFADGGRIVKTKRTDYAEHVGQKDMMPIVRRLMKEQHKAMFIALRAGELDELLEKICGPLLSPAAEPERQPSAELSAAPDSPPRDATSEVHAVPVHAPPSEVVEKAAPQAAELGVVAEQALAAGSGAPRRPPPPPKRGPRGSSAAPSPSAKAAVKPAAKVTGDSGRYASSRPAAIFAEPPSPEHHSIFGDSVISEKSLDEVILSYLAEDLEAPVK